MYETHDILFTYSLFRWQFISFSYTSRLGLQDDPSPLNFLWRVRGQELL